MESPLYPHQAEIYHTDKLHALAIWGRRTGKTTLAHHILLRDVAHRDCLYICPNWAMLQHSIGIFLREEPLVRYNRTEGKLTFPHGNSIYLRHKIETESLYLNYAHIILDEAQLFSDRVIATFNLIQKKLTLLATPLPLNEKAQKKHWLYRMATEGQFEEHWHRSIGVPSPTPKALKIDLTKLQYRTQVLGQWGFEEETE